MISAGDVDYLAIAGIGLVVAGVFAIVLRPRPRTALVLWTLTLCFVPYWVGVNLVGPFLPAVTALAMLLIVALPGAGWAKIHVVDVILGLFLVLVLIAFGLSYVSLPDVFVVVSEWTAGYLFGRLISELVDLRTIYAVFGGVMSVAAGLAIIEFITSWNPFVLINFPGPSHAIWSALQMRGGFLRAEGAFGHSIALGATCSLALPLVLGSDFRRWVKYLCALCLCGAAVLTFSRIGLATTGIALLLSVLFLRVGLTTRVRAWLAVLLVIGAVFAYPRVSEVFSSAGQEAEGSAQYRVDLTSLIPSMRVIGTSGILARSAEGSTSWGRFESIDSALILAGLLYGFLPLLLLVVAYIGAVFVILRGQANPPVIGVVAQLPAFIGVALITQYASALWFMVGVAVVASAGHQEDISRVTGYGALGRAPTLELKQHIDRRLTPVEEK